MSQTTNSMENDAIFQAILQQRAEAYKGAKADTETFPFDTQGSIYSMTPMECLGYLQDICVSETKVVQLDNNAVVLVKLPFGELRVQSAFGHWGEDFQSEVLEIQIEFADLFHNNPKGLNSINKLMNYGMAVSEESKLKLKRTVSIAGGRSTESLLREIAGVNQDGERLYAMLTD